MTQALPFREPCPARVELTDDGHLLIHDLLYAPTTVAFLRTQDEGVRPMRLEQLLELATQHYQTADASALLELLGERANGAIERFTVDLTGDFRDKLKGDFETNRKSLQQEVEAFATELKKGLRAYFDPNAPEAVPSLIGHRVDERLKSFAKLLDDGEGGALARQSQHIIKALREDIDLLRRTVVERQTLDDRGIEKGATYEDLLARRIGLIGRALMGEVKRVRAQPGLKRSKAGDIVLTVQGALTQGHAVSLVFEAKDRDENGHRFSEVEIRRECEAACANRGAQTAIFVAVSQDILPGGRGFGITGGHYWLAWPRVSDDTSLALVIHVALTEIVREHLCRSDQQDPDAIATAKHLVAQAVEQLERFEAIDTSHSSAIKAIQKASGGVAELRAALQGTLRRLDGLLLPITA